MSNTETHFGKLRRVDTVLTVEDWCRNQCLLAGKRELESYYKNWQEKIRGDFNEKYFIVGGQIWEVIEHIEVEEGEDINIMIPNPDQTITFVQQFYNGGTCLGEIIEEYLGKK